MQASAIRQLIEAGIPGSQVDVDGDGRHFAVTVVSVEFEGKNRVQKHQLVYRALGDKVGADIHALSIEAYTPEEWEKRKPPLNVFRG